MIATLAPAIAGADCAALDARLDDLLKLSAMEEMDSIMDNSAPRDTVRQLKLARYMTERATIFAQMQATGCKLPAAPLDWQIYAQAASRCRAPTPAQREECNIKNWKTK